MTFAGRRCILGAMTNQERIERIYARRTFGIKPGLETTLALLERLGHPERGLGVVHIAGTNGKGSVSTLVASVLKTAGFKTGLYTSPHLVKLNERFKIDGVDIADDALDALLAEVEDAATAVEKNGGQVECQVTKKYDPYVLAEDSLVIRSAVQAAQAAGLSPVLEGSGGGSDANFFNRYGVPNAVLGTGMSKVHTKEEFIREEHLFQTTEWVLQLIKQTAHLKTT